LAESKPAPCQVRSKTGNPCLRSAKAEILGVAFCGPCAREQEAYFVIGELTDEEGRGFRSKPLAEALRNMRRERSGSTGEIAAGVCHGLPSINETESLALRSG
jgi:hypothetical protein